MNKKYFMNLLTVLMVAFLSVGIASCSKDDDDDVSYNLSDEEAITLLQGTWDIAYTETDDEGSETDNYVWEISGNRIKEYNHWQNFSVKNGILYFTDYDESYKLTKLTTTEFRCYGEYIGYGKNNNRINVRVDIVGKKK